MLLLNKHNLNIAKIASREESRYTLKAIQVTDRETVVTDGHRLVRVTLPTECKPGDFPQLEGFTPNGNGTPFLLDRDTALQATKLIPKKTTIPILNHAAVSACKGEDGQVQQIQVCVTDLDHTQVLRPKPDNGRFPAWECVLPAGEPLAEVCLDASYIEELGKLLREFGGSGLAVRIRVYGKEKAVRMDARNGDGQEMNAVVMPLRSSESKFFNDPTPAAEEARRG